MERVRQILGGDWALKIICFFGFVSMIMGFICIIMSLELSRQIQQTTFMTSDDEKIKELSSQLVQLATERDNYKLQMEILQKNSEKLIDELKVQACISELEGQGVIVILDDSTNVAKSGEDPNSFLIHDEDILRVINELRAAGAKALSINGQRLTATSEIRCAGPTVSVNNVRSAAPFEIRAIGDSQALKSAVKMRGGVEDSLKVWGIKIKIETSDKIHIPAFK